MTKIEWCDETWNPVTGCTPVSAGCDNCYAARMIGRNLPNMGHTGPFSQVQFHLDRLDIPRHWRKPRRIFVGSMTDLWHPDIADAYLKSIEGVIADCPQHTFMTLTKRPERMAKYFDWNLPYQNHWLGVTIENNAALWRWDCLDPISNGIRFISFEPLLEKIGMMDLEGASWVIAGCESGPERRHADEEWFRSLKDQCVADGVPFFLKQMDVNGKLTKMPMLDGRVWDQRP